MKKLVYCAGAIALATPAMASAGETYVGVSGGIVLPSNSQNSGSFDSAVPATADWPEIPADTSLGWTTEFEEGYAISGQFGHAFDNGFRAELELNYSEYDVQTHSGLTVGGTNIDALDVAVLTRGAPDAANPTVGEVIADGQGSVSNWGIFANGFYDFNPQGTFKPYIGAGLGYVNTDVKFSPSGVDVADENDDGFAWQGIIGASFAVSENVDIFAQGAYRERFEDADIPLNLLPATLGVETGQTTVSAGVRFRFGG